jgi:hypothetical protein
MGYYKKTDYKLLGYRKSNTKNKKYDAVIKRTGSDKEVLIPFGDIRYENYHDLTGLNLYKLHGDKKRRTLYKQRHKKDLLTGYFSPGYFSYFILW